MPTAPTVSSVLTFWSSVRSTWTLAETVDSVKLFYRVQGSPTWVDGSAWISQSTDHVDVGMLMPLTNYEFSMKSKLNNVESDFGNVVTLKTGKRPTAN